MNLRSKRQGEFESRTLSCTGALDRYCAAVQFHDFTDDRQAKAKTLGFQRGRAFILAEPFEKVRLEIGADSLTRVSDGDQRVRTGVLEGNLHLAAFRRKTDGIRKHVPECLPEPAGIAGNGSGCGLQIEIQSQALIIGCRAQCVCCIFDDARQVDGSLLIDTAAFLSMAL
jgi:hypothetical protein